MPDEKPKLTEHALAILRDIAKAETGCNVVAPSWITLLDEHAARGKRIAELESALTLATEAVAAEAEAKVERITCTEAERSVLDEARDLDTADIDAIRNVHRDFGDSLLELMRCRLVARR